MISLRRKSPDRQGMSRLGRLVAKVSVMQRRAQVDIDRVQINVLAIGAR